MSKPINLKHSVIQEEPNEGTIRYRGTEIEDEDLDIYSKLKSLNL